MNHPDHNSDRVPVSIEVARIIVPEAPRAVQLAAAQGTLPLTGADLLTALAFLCTNTDAEVKSAALHTLRTLPQTMLMSVLADPALHPRLLDLLARVRPADSTLMEQIIAHPAVRSATLHLLAQRADRAVLTCLLHHRARLDATTLAALRANPQANPTLTGQFAQLAEQSATTVQELGETAGESDPDEFPPAVDGDPAEVHDVSDEQIASLLQDAEARELSRYQLAMELKVAEKIKLAMTGDKEWRKVLIKDPNKLVHGAVLRNQRIDEGEVLTVARQKSSSDEIVRLILRNRDWMKNSEIRKALALHPKTPLPRALRLVSELPLSELKMLVKSRNVSNAIVTAARKEVEIRVKRGGG